VRGPASGGGRVLRGLLLAIAIPGLLFAILCSVRGGVCLDAYAWEAGTGFRPARERCAPGEQAGAAAGIRFYARFVAGIGSGRSGLSREDTTRSLAALLGQRTGRSAAIVGVAIGALALHALAGVGLGWLRRRRARSGRPDEADPDERRPRFLSPPAGLPLPIAGFVLFAAVVRILPPGHPLDFDRAGILWAGLALAWADGVAALLFVGLGRTAAAERWRPWADTTRLLGGDPEPAIADVTARARAAQVRGALLALLGGLLVVEGVFGVNGLGETLRDLVVDRQGLDPLLLCGVLLVFTLGVAVVELLPVERAVARWRT
jgi:hypothetical protein